MKVKYTFSNIQILEEFIRQKENDIIWKNRTKQRHEEHWKYNTWVNILKFSYCLHFFKI